MSRYINCFNPAQFQAVSITALAALYGLIFMFVSSCASASGQTQEYFNEFYLGLKAGSTEEKIKLFENSLSSPNVYIRQASSEQLALLMRQDAELSKGTVKRVHEEASGWWKGAFDALNDMNRANILAFLLGFEQNTPFSFEEARLFVLDECEKQGISFSDSETAAIEGHYAVSVMKYNDALISFRKFRNDGIWPSQMPEIFYEYPNLINDLGRAFQYTSSGSEGFLLFSQWEQNLSGADDLRYRLLFFAARVARRMGQSAQAISLFERALSFAPDHVQNDACIWYILDLSVSGSLNAFMERIEQFVPQLITGSTVNDVMERYLHRLVSARDWGRVIGTYNLIKDTDGLVLKAGFAWVIARAIEEKYLSADESRLLENSGMTGVSDFMQIAYNAGSSLVMPAPYYRMLSADWLGLPFINFSEDIRESAETPAVRFLLGFFTNDIADLSVPYIRSLEGSLNPDELRTVAYALENAEMYTQSTRLISLYINMSGYEKNRQDLEIMFPRPFLKLIESNADAFNIAPSLLFALIRQESLFQTAVNSRAGAAGLMQLMQPTARDMAERIRRAGGPNFFSPNGSVDSANQDINVYIGSYYYNYLRNLFNNNDQLSLMAYNGGLGRVRQWRNASSLPVDLLVETVTIYETRDYGRRIPALARIYEELHYR